MAAHRERNLRTEGAPRLQARHLQKRLDSVVRFDKQWIDGLYRQIEQLESERLQAIKGMLTGEGLILFGKPVKVTLEWPEGRPYCCRTDEQMREFGAGL